MPPQSESRPLADDNQRKDSNIVEITDTQTQRTQVIRHAIQIIDKHTGKQLGQCNAERGTSHISIKFLITGILQCDPNHCTLLAEDGNGYHGTVGPETKMIYVIVAPKKTPDLEARSRSPARGQSQTNMARRKQTDAEASKDEDDAHESHNDQTTDAHNSDSDFMICDYENIYPKPAQKQQATDTSTEASSCDLLSTAPKEEPEEEDRQHDEDHALSQTTHHQINPHEETGDKEKRANRIMAEPAGHFRQRIKPCPPDRQSESGRGTNMPKHPSGTLGGTAARPKRSTSQPPSGDMEAKRGKTQQSLSNEEAMQGFEPHHADGVERGIVLVLLFAGGLHDLHAFLNLVRSQGHPGAIKAVYTAEHNAEVSMATLQWWNDHGTYLGAPPVEQVASNVWELVKNPGILAQRLRHTDENTLVLVGGGSPCQDLSNVNKQHKHKLAGSQSVNYFAIPFITWVARQVCKANIQSYFENVAGADKESKDIMCAALCILPKDCVKG